MSKNINSIMRSARYSLEAKIEKEEEVKLNSEQIHQMNRADDRVNNTHIRNQKYNPVGSRGKMNKRGVTNWRDPNEVGRWIDSFKE